jgi:DNA mismatch repair protein MutS
MRREAPAVAKTDPLSEALAEINPDELTPREALEALYRLRKLQSS